MKDHCGSLAKALSGLALPEGMSPSPIRGIYCVKISEPSLPVRRRWHASLAIIGQGTKEIKLDSTIHRAGAGHYTASLVELPVISRVVGVSRAKPMLAVMMELDPFILREVAARLNDPAEAEPDIAHRSLSTGQAGERMLEATLRLVRLFSNPEEAAALGPLLIREIFFYLLKGPSGASIRSFVKSGSRTHQLSQAIYRLRAELNEEVKVEELAKASSMSRAAFFRHFKELTSLSPIQYQKRLRLIEARRCLQEEGDSAEAAAFRVGYRSASQFSREYTRMFGHPPGRDRKR